MRGSDRYGVLQLLLGSSVGDSYLTLWGNIIASKTEHIGEQIVDCPKCKKRNLQSVIIIQHTGFT